MGTAIQCNQHAVNGLGGSAVAVPPWRMDTAHTFPRFGNLFEGCVQVELLSAQRPVGCSAFRVLGLHHLADSELVLLREVPVGTPSADGLDDRDRAVLPALADALAPFEAMPEDAPAGTRDPGARWPGRCTGPVHWR